jgi:hypothetical protein
VDDAIAWCGFVGAWLLFGGPVYQAVLELHEQDIERDRIAEVGGQVDAPPRVSRWWWLLPPVRYLLERRRRQEWRRAVMAALSPGEVEALITYIDKATGWLFVGLGGLLIAVKETWELREQYEWPLWVFWALVAVAAIVATGNAAYRLERSRRALGAGDSPDP